MEEFPHEKTCVLFSTILSLNASLLPLIGTTSVSAEEITRNADTTITVPDQMKMTEEESNKLESYEQSIQDFKMMQQKITDSMTIDSSNHYI